MVVETGSLTQAAERLGIAVTAVSRRLKDLELRLGAPLIQRTTRRMYLNEVGQGFYERCKAVLDELEAAQQEVLNSGGGLGGVLRISAPLSFGVSHMSSAIAQFMHAHPDVRIDMDLSDKRVDLVAEGFDLAIRIGVLSDSSLIAKKISTVRHIPCASPDFLARYPEITKPEDLRRLKIRVPASDLYIAMVNALGADAVPIPFGEIYQSLAQGVIDGAENNWPTFVGERHYEVANYLSLTQHLLTPEALVMSQARWERLSRADQLLVREATKASVVEMRRLWDIRVGEAEAAVAASDVAVNTVDTEPFAALMRPVWDQFITTPAQQDIVRRIRDMREG